MSLLFLLILNQYGQTTIVNYIPIINRRRGLGSNTYYICPGEQSILWFVDRLEGKRVKIGAEFTEAQSSAN